jgi:septum site-determining protein MinC
MTPDTSSRAAATPAPQETPEISLELQVRLKTEDGQLLLLLPPETNIGESATAAASTWTELWQQLKVRLNAGERFWQANAEVQLVASDRLLDIRQLQEIAEALAEEFTLAAVKQPLPPPPLVTASNSSRPYLP